MIKYLLPLLLISQSVIGQAYCDIEKCCTADHKCIANETYKILETIRKTTIVGAPVPVLSRGTAIIGTVRTTTISGSKEHFQGKAVSECVIISGSPIVRYVIAGCKNIIMEGEEAK